MRFSKPSCFAFIAHAPQGTSLKEADHRFNSFISDKRNGLVIFHDHFVDEPGAIAIFYVKSDAELKQLELHEGLAGWGSELHLLSFTERPAELLYQATLTMGEYRGQRLRDLLRESGTEEDSAKG